jgi:hypothetical protein
MPQKHHSAPIEAKPKLTSKKKYVRVKDRRQGLATKNRTQTDKPKNANQWISDIRQDKFAQNWLDPSSETFANAYQSALKAGYSAAHAKQITSTAQSLEWVKEARSRLPSYKPEHIVKKLENLTNASKDSDKIRALELLGKINGLFVDRSIQQIDEQFTNQVPRPEVIDQTPDTTQQG